jgi:hypothetical protein
MFNTAARGVGLALVVAGLTKIFMPQTQWTMGFYPKGTPSGSSEWFQTIMDCGAFVTALGLSIMGFVPEGIFASGVAGAGAALWHKRFGVNLISTLWLITLAIGAQGVFAKYFTAGARAVGAPTPKGSVMTQIRGLSATAMKGLSWLLLLGGIQHFLLPKTSWTLGFFPTMYTVGSTYFQYTISCSGAVMIALSAKLMGCPNEGVLTTAGLGILGSTWYYENLAVNPPTILGLTMLGVGAYGLVTRHSGIGAAPSPNAARRRSMPIPGRVE